jgi:PAS domain S-box-containing protein
MSVDETVKLLLVDDEERNLDVLESILQSSGCQFVRAKSADEALLALLHHEFAAIVLDIKMPGIDGLELAQLIKARKRTRHVPIVFLTAHILEEKDILHAYDVGGVDYLIKPINPHILRSKVGVFVDLFRTTRALGNFVDALHSEIAEREKVQEELRQAKVELELRVLERTAELDRANREIRDSEARLSAILQNTRALVYLMDAESRFLHINRQLEQLLGKPSSEVLGRSVYDVLPQDTAATLDTNNCRVLMTGEATEFEETIEQDDGVHVYTSIRAPLLDEAGSAHGVVCVSTDITERKRLADALREADRRKDEFLATLAHELRNPLAPIRYALQAVNRTGPMTSELQWAISLIDRQTQHMARLINDLLDVNRITRKTLELRPERVELARIINSVTESSRPFIRAAGHELTIQLPSLPIYLNADVVRLAQVFSNLLHNASKYAGKRPQEPGQILITAKEVRNKAVVTVKDSGIGIAAAVLPRVFEMFTQIGRSLEQTEGGLGIGLALAKSLVEMHGGTIEAHSEGPGKGTEFTVTLPLAAEESHYAVSYPALAVPRFSAKRRILIADDSKDVTEAFKTMLAALGHDVESAHDGIEALEKAARFHPEIVVLDVGMPRLNGYETARRFKQQPWARGKDVVLIAVTGWGNESNQRQSEEAGFDVHLVKPVDPIAFGHLIDTLRFATEKDVDAVKAHSVSNSGTVTHSKQEIVS